MTAHDTDLAQSGAVTSLRSFVDRIARLEEEKKALAEDIKDVKAEAKSQGFDVKVITQMVRETMMSEDQRAEQLEYEAICELYRASLGMLRGTPLGDAARKRAEAKPPRDQAKKSAEAPSPIKDEPSEEAVPPLPQEDIDTARDLGREAGRRGDRVFSNPYVNGDPRRAAWDEGWCETSGSDGMDVPDAWRRKRKAKLPSEDEGEK